MENHERGSEVNGVSDVARVRRQIELEYQAAARGLSGTALIGSHDFINARYEILGEHLDTLCLHMPVEAAMEVLMEIGDTTLERERVLLKANSVSND